MTCHFNYLTPALWNFIFVLYFMLNRIGGVIPWYERTDYIRCGMIVAGSYLSIHSNLWHSIILMSYFGVELLFELICSIRKRKGKIFETQFFRKYIKDEFPMLFAIVIWFISMILEVNGGRANWEGNSESTLQVKASAKAFLESFNLLNKNFVVIILTVNIMALMLALKKWREPEAGSYLLRQLKKLVIIMITNVFLILVASKVSPDYLKNPTVMISWMLWILFCSVESFTYILKEVPRTAWALPLAIYIMIFSVIVNKSTFADNCASSLPPSVIKALDDDIIVQVKTGEATGETRVTVYIPEKGSGGWPLNPGMMQNRISNALYYHGVTERHMEIFVVPDPSKDAEFNLN